MFVDILGHLSFIWKIVNLVLFISKAKIINNQYQQQ